MERQDWNRRFANDALRDAAKKKVLHASAAVRAHHDQINVLCSSEIENLRRRVPGCDENLM